MTKIPSSQDNRIFWIAAGPVIVFVYFFGLTIPLLGPDEPRYSQVAREMFERGDWITPTLGGFHWFEKPALLYWLQIASYSIFGVTEFAARFGSAIFGLATIGSLWLLGRRAAKAASISGEFANLLALIAASTIGLIVFARGASFDIILTFPLTAAMVCFFLFDLSQEIGGKDGTAEQRSDREGVLPLFGFYVFIGVALLAKGLVGIVFPFAIVAFYFLISRRWPGRTFLVSLVWGTPIALAVAATWYLPMYLRHGWEFVDQFFIQHHFQRYTSNKYLHPQPFHFFFWVLPLMTIPWLPFFLVAVWKFGKRAFYREREPVRKGPDAAGEVRELELDKHLSIAALLRFAAAWLLVPLVFFSFSGSKLPGYILPAVPPAIVITSVYLMTFIRGGARRAAMVKALAMATFVTVVGIVIFALPRFADTDSVKGLIDAANRRGYRSEKVLTLHTVSHNAEFYAPGRLLRDDEGKQRQLPGPAEVLEELQSTGQTGALVIVPLEHLQQLIASQALRSDVIRDNGEFAIVYVSPSTRHRASETVH